jgi:predicted ATP-binding protein involved in virulence
VPELERLGEAEWVYRPSNEILNLSDVTERFGDEIELRFPGALYEQALPDWFRRLQGSLNVYFIRANRLEFRANRLEGREGGFERRVSQRTSSTLPVASYARELARRIQRTLAQYAELSQSLDRSFPRRLVESSRPAGHSIESIRRRLSKLEARRNSLTEAGLLDKEAHTPFDTLSVIDETRADVLSVYIDDVEKKLSVFDDLSKRIDLLQTILNRRFLFKTVSIDKSDGIIFSTADGNRLSPSSLSSGEQHEVVLLYQLLFRVKPQTLILIDEPELSLHIAWQEQFLKDLAQITTLSDFDVLIATHSPQIISDRWDLTVELRGPNGCERTLPTTPSLTR